MKRLSERLLASLTSLQSLLWGVLVAFAVLGGAVVWGFIRQENFNDRLEDQQAQIEADRVATAESGCRTGAETRQLLRTISRDVGLVSGTTSGKATAEAIITVALAGGQVSDKTRAAVAALRAELDRTLTPTLKPALEGIVNTLPDRRWDPKTKTCVDVALDTGG